MSPQDLKTSPYGYTPTGGACILFVVLFGISTILHLGQAIRYRLWWIFPTVIFCGLLETLGWSARLWSSIAVLQPHPFEIQLIVTICGPTPLAAANFTLLGAVILRLGPMYSRLGPKSYTTIFLICDILSLFVQGIGAGIAAKEVIQLKSPKLGGHIMLTGIILQLATLSVYALCAGEFLWRFLSHRPLSKYTKHLTSPASKPAPLTQRQKIMIGAMAFNLLCLFIRAIYRVIELKEGFRGRIMQTEVYFSVLDGGMIALAIFTFNFAHPGFLLYRVPEKQQRKSEMKMDSLA
ncbi:RTA1 like protein-domain-containing protein [Mycena galopus ATCC 62051]|nr:RTA1 like protein-domain-containing protein [Mycena galopus ATCC 62051]